MGLPIGIRCKNLPTVGKKTTPSEIPCSVDPRRPPRSLKPDGIQCAKGAPLSLLHNTCDTQPVQSRAWLSTTFKYATCLFLNSKAFRVATQKISLGSGMQCISNRPSAWYSLTCHLHTPSNEFVLFGCKSLWYVEINEKCMRKKYVFACFAGAGTVAARGLL